MTNQAQPAVDAPFVARHIGPRHEDQAKMLATIGLQTIDDLLDAAIPESIRLRDRLDLSPGASEHEVLDRLRQLADRNQVLVSMIGQGYYGTFTPEVIRRNVFENPAWYTAYTPYQPEISQGRLEVLLRFQTMVCELTGMDVAGASLLDDATAAAEAMTLAHRVSKSKSVRFAVDSSLHPQVIEVIQTRAEPLGFVVDVVDPEHYDPADCFGLLLAHVSTTGRISSHDSIVDAAKRSGVFVCVHTDLLACMLLDGPGSWGVDAVVGSAQRFGVPMFAGGPHAGFLAVRDQHKRSLPGRLVGVSVDAAGRRAYRLALQTREQHIRREKATSNICTAQVLLAVASALYACWHGQEGLEQIALRVHGHATRLATGLVAAGHSLEHDTWFDTVTVLTDSEAAADSFIDRACDRGINLRRVDARRISISCDETTTELHVNTVLEVFDAAVSSTAVDPTRRAQGLNASLPGRREGDALKHEVFHRHLSETDMLRELRRLSDRDLALDRTMIPLGSCTMKLNATTEMVPVTWPAFANVHPFAPADQLGGTIELVRQLEAMLVEITGYDAVSVQPNAGSQGELAGLLAIRAYHRSRGDEQRSVCLIPTSAHGTNAASAVMAGMTVVAVKCDESGNVDVADLRASIDRHCDTLAALMITYPSTHGVFEDRIVEICELIHAAGGQVYLDGANFNALVGTGKPGKFGADVSHLNLHKTFCIPHGGGGPGVGPVCVKAHLAPFLPTHRTRPELAEQHHADADSSSRVGAVSAAAWGSAGILSIPWSYISMMGPEGLRDATAVAILNANYIATRLAPSYPVLYTGQGGRVAHECILDLRPITAATGISVDDVAKRLIDFGFHAPTMSFPVAGTLMVEPTESESLHEIDRFCDAMISIRHEIDKVAAGEWPADDNPLVNAPHTADDVLVEEWTHPYTRAEAASPNGHSMADKYWPPVSRIDGAYGDRNVFCSCPPMDVA